MPHTHLDRAWQHPRSVGQLAKLSRELELSGVEQKANGGKETHQNQTRAMLVCNPTPLEQSEEGVELAAEGFVARLKTALAHTLPSRMHRPVASSANQRQPHIGSPPAGTSAHSSIWSHHQLLTTSPG
jgi:hypothetical protein